MMTMADPGPEPLDAGWHDARTVDADQHPVTAAVDGNRDTLALAVDGILAIDEHGVIQYCNPAAAQLLGRKGPDLVGAPVGFPLILHQTSEIDVFRPGGHASAVEIHVTTTGLDEGPLYIAALRDITDRKEAIQNLRDAIDARDLVIAVTAHELNDPLFAISVLLRLLRKARTDEKRHELIDLIAERTEHLQALVRKLRAASRIDREATAPQTESVPLFDFILERLGGFDTRYEDVRLACARDTAVRADRHDLSEMLANYLENALAYGAPPTEIHVSTKELCVEIRVRDHGEGVPADYEDHLFERFARGPGTERARAGTGLGLWIVRSLARGNGGEAWHERGSDGATFCVSLPRG
jgi:signal transduction histidine kinase